MRDNNGEMTIVTIKIRRDLAFHPLLNSLP